MTALTTFDRKPVRVRHTAAVNVPVKKLWWFRLGVVALVASGVVACVVTLVLGTN